MEIGKDLLQFNEVNELNIVSDKRSRWYLAIIILLTTAFMTVNMVVLLCASWILIYAGVIFLGFGGGRWTSDFAA